MVSTFSWRGALAALAVASLSGCNAPPLIDPAYREIPQHQADAGYASASVVAMVPIEDARRVLGTTTTLSLSQAMQLVQAYSRYQHEQAINSLQVGLNLGLSGKTRTGTQTDATDSSTSTTQTATSAITGLQPTPSTPGSVSSTTSTTTTVIDSTGKTSTSTVVQSIVQGTASTPDLGTQTWPSPSTNFSSVTLTVNPTIALQAADQLMKLYNMVSHQLDSVPYSRRTQKAYVVQIKTTLQPHKPALPLDAFVTITAVPDFSAHPGTLADVKLQPLAFGTEEYEFSQLESADQYLRGLALGLTAVSPAGALGASARSMVGRVLEASAVDVNGVISAAALSPSTVQIRLGAMWQGASDRAMIPRSFSGFFVLVVPRAYHGNVEIVTKPLFRDPKTGRFVGGTPPPEIIDDVKREFCTFGLVLESGCVYGAGARAGEPHDDWYAFLRRIRRNDYAALSCVKARPAEAAKPKEGNASCRTYSGGPLHTAMVAPGAATVDPPAFLLGSFISEINRIGLKVRSSSSFIPIP